MLTAEKVETLLEPIRQQWITEGYDFEWRVEVTPDEFGNPYVYVDLMTDRELTVADVKRYKHLVTDKLTASPEMEGYWQYVAFPPLTMSIEE